MPEDDLTPPPGLEGAVRMVDASGTPRWVAPQMAARLGFAPGSPAPRVPGLETTEPTPEPAPDPTTRLPSTIETAGGFQMGTVQSERPPLQSMAQREIAEDDRATMVARGLQERAEPEGSGVDYAALATAAAGGDPQASYALGIAAQQGDPRAQRVLSELDLGVRMGVLRPGGGGGGGPRTTQTATTRQTQLARAPTEEEAAALQQADAQAADADRRYIDGLTQQYEAEARGLREGAERMQRAQVDLEAVRQQQETARRAQEAEINRRTREVDSMIRDVGARQVDSKRLFSKGETGNRASAAIGLLLGGLGDAFTGGTQGTDAVMGIITRSIDQDIEDQARNISNARASIGDRQSMLGEMRARLGADDAAREAVRAAMLEDAARKVRSLQAVARSDGQRAQLQQLLAQLDANKAEALRGSVLSGIGTTEVETVQQRRSGGGGRRRQIDFGAAIPEAPEVDSQERARLAEQQTRIENGIRTIDRALELVDDAPVGLVSGRVASSRSARELERTLTQAALPAVAEAFGAATPDQVRMMQESLGFTRTATPEELRSALVTERERLMRQAQGAQLSVGEGAVQEARQRAPAVRRQLAVEEGRAEDVAPSFRRER